MKEQKKWSEMTPQERTKGCFILSIFSIIMIIFVAAITCEGSPDQEEQETEVALPPVHNSPFDGSVQQVKDYLKANLNDADSYESVEWSPVVQDTITGRYMVMHKYRAKNAFGGKILCIQTFVLDSLGNVLSVSNLDE